MNKAVAVIDIGITNLKISLIDHHHQIIARCQTGNILSAGPPYRHMDLEPIWNWLLSSLCELATAAAIEAIIPCTHGSAVALIEADGLVLPVMHYEARPPAPLATEVTSLGAQTNLWALRQGNFSTLVDEQGWRGLCPPRRNAWDTLALIHPYNSRHTGIAAGTLQRIDPLIIAGFDDYAVRWRERAQTPASS
jgi:sugar (pentulose or hexulose) kinase